MGWFDHRHYWYYMTDLTITKEGKNLGVMIMEKCSCGAVRTIEIAQGKEPVVRMTAQP